MEDAGVAPGTRVVEAEIIGNERVSDEALFEGLATRPPSGLLLKSYTYYDPLQVEADVERIEAHYRGQGYYSAQVMGVTVRPADTEGTVVRFLVTEGEPTRIVEVSVRGLPDALEAELARIERDQPDADPTAVLQRGEVFEHEEYLAAKDALRRWLIERGYAWARVGGEVVVDADARAAIVRLYPDPGPLVRFGETTVVGLGRIPATTVRARLGWQRGQVFDPGLLALTQERLYQLGFFSTVSIDLIGEGRPAVAGVRVRVREAPRQELKLGAGLAADNTGRQLRLRVEHRSVGIFDPLTVVQLRLRPAFWVSPDFEDGSFGGDVMLQLSRHDLGVPRLHGAARASYRTGAGSAYHLRAPGMRLQVSRPFALDRLLVGLAWELNRPYFSHLHPAITDNDDDPALEDKLGLVKGGYWQGFLEQTVAYDRRSDILAPRSGYHLQLRLEEGGPYAGGARTYVLGVAEARGYVPLGDTIVVAGRLRHGRTLLGPVPITQRFYSGGASAHRGFTQRALTPVASQRASTSGEDAGAPPAPRARPDSSGTGDKPPPSVAIGGELLLESNLEVRADLFKIGGYWLSTALFVDAGDVLDRGQHLDLGNLHWAVGAGLRYDTRIGPVRLDVGRRLTRMGGDEPAPDEPWAFHVSLGEAF